MPRDLNEYEYDESPDNPGMQSAVENARAKLAYNTAADDNPVKYDPADQPTPTDDPQPMQLPELDFSDSGPFGKDSGGPDDDLKGLQTQPTGDGPGKGALQFATPGTKSPAPQAQDEYTQALQRIKQALSKPTPDYAKGYGEARQKDDSENRTNRILDYLSAGLRRAPTASLTPGATNASDYLKQQGLEQSRSGGELARLGQLARLAKPATSKEGGNVEGLRAYLVKVGAGSPEELAGFNESQLKAAMTGFGLKHRIDTHDTERAQDLDWRKTVHSDAQANTDAMRALALRNEGKLPAGEAEKLGGADAAIQAIDDLSKDWDAKASASGSGLTQYVPGSDANTYLPGLRATTQMVGTYLEGGKLTDADVPKYEAMMPQPRDTAAQKEAKVAALKRLIAQKRAAEGKALQGSGYRVPGGKVRVSNGKETLLIDPDDVEAAARDGYREVRR